MNGKEDPDWKIWGFAEESTPDRIAEDEKYWDEMVKANAA
jgi:protein MBA1